MNKMTLAQLRAHIAALENPERKLAVLPFGVTEIDAVLPWGGLPMGGLHEIDMPPDDAGDGPALGFVAVLLGRLAVQQRRPVLWVSGRDDLYAPGLAGFGLAAEQLLMVRPGRGSEILAAMEEGTRCCGLAAVAGEVWTLDGIAVRRLQLAARESGSTVLVMTRGDGHGTALTRWRVGPAPSAPPIPEAVGEWRWWLTLTHCRGRGTNDDGVVARWLVEWNDETHRLRLAAVSGDRSAVPEDRRRAAG
ncbi:damage-inducible mutagenesis protein [Telmatospirillum sp.]|uniref:ImuA family protein n=1 Tax=Telmatospirillum sp. TaxID=2079197 RepID=UPI0028444B9E|nr:damage-inducible mutagenesis protein [Telmatospirillum sp.]MDR3441123.1 damage-inducible mutagenesis protein [Telmatospirillum sp.]